MRHPAEQQEMHTIGFKDSTILNNKRNKIRTSNLNYHGPKKKKKEESINVKKSLEGFRLENKE